MYLMEKELYELLAGSEGEDEVVIYCKMEKVIKRLPRNRNIRADDAIVSALMGKLGENCVKVVEKPIEKLG